MLLVSGQWLPVKNNYMASDQIDITLMLKELVIMPGVYTYTLTYLLQLLDILIQGTVVVYVKATGKTTGAHHTESDKMGHVTTYVQYIHP